MKPNTSNNDEHDKSKYWITKQWFKFSYNQRKVLVFSIILTFLISIPILVTWQFIDMQNNHILKSDCYSMMSEQYRQGLALNEDGFYKLALIYFPIIKWFFIAILVSWVIHGVQLRLLA